MGMFKKIKKRLKEDNGNAIVILGIMLIMALMLVGGLLLDFSKAYQVKSSYIDAAKKATQAAVQEQTTKGYLKPEAAGEAVRVYEQVTRPAVINPDGYFSKCEDYGDQDVVLSIDFIDESGNKIHVGSIRRDQVGSAETAASITNKMMSTSTKNHISGKNYIDVQLTLTEGTENVILPGAFKITQADSERAANMKCQKMDIAARANVFTGETGKYK